MAEDLRRLRRDQLLELLVAQGKELEAQREATARAQKEAEDLANQIQKMGSDAILVLRMLDQARKARTEAEKQAAVIIERAKAEARALQQQPARPQPYAAAAPAGPQGADAPAAAKTPAPPAGPEGEPQ